jgi:hypothetical protein
VIQRDHFTSAACIRQEAVFSLNHIHLMMPPAQLSFQAVANPSQTRGFLTHKHRTTLPHLSQQSCFSDASRPHDDDVFSIRVKRSKSLHFFLATREGEALIHEDKLIKPDIE